MGEGEGGMIWENGIETCKLSYVKRIASPGSMHDAGCSGLVHWDGPEGWDGEGKGDPLQYSCLENPMDRGAQCPWGRKESDTTERLHFHFLYCIGVFLSGLLHFV